MRYIISLLLITGTLSAQTKWRQIERSLVKWNIPAAYDSIPGQTGYAGKWIKFVDLMDSLNINFGGTTIDSVTYTSDSLRIYTSDTTFVTEIMSGQQYDLNPYILGGDTVGFILFNSMDTVVFEAGDSITGPNVFLNAGFGIDILQLDSLYTISVDSSQIATKYDLTQLSSNLTFSDGTTIDFTVTGTTVTAEVKANSIGATELSSTTVTAGTYTNSTITVDGDGRITSASSGSGGGETIYKLDPNEGDFVVETDGWTEYDYMEINLAETGMYELMGVVGYETTSTSAGLGYGFVSNNTMGGVSGYFAININSATTAEDNTLFRSINTLNTSINNCSIEGTGVNPANTGHSGHFRISFFNNNTNNKVYFQIKGETNGQTYRVYNNTTYFKLKKL